MPRKTIDLNVKLNLTDKGDAPDLEAYVFNNNGELLQSEKLDKQKATLKLPAELLGRNVEVLFGPKAEKGQALPTAKSLKRSGGITKRVQLQEDNPLLQLDVPSLLFPKRCLCLVRGKLVKKVNLPDGSVAEWPVCNARVHICEVDPFRLILPRLIPDDLYRLRDDLLDNIRIPEPFPKPPKLPDIPDYLPFRELSASTQKLNVPSSLMQTFSIQQQSSLSTIASTNSIEILRGQFLELSDFIRPLLPRFPYLWRYYVKDRLTTVEVDESGYFSTLIGYNCKDKPDLYFWVEQFQEAGWQTVYKPSVATSTFWNYDCGTELTLYIPNAEACEVPSYDIPDGVTKFVLPYAIGHAPIFGNPDTSSNRPPNPVNLPLAPLGWVRSDGYINYKDGNLGVVNNAPFAHTLFIRHDDSYLIPNDGIKYYRYSYRRLGTSDWTPISRPIPRRYRTEYSDRLPTYDSATADPTTVDGESSLFEFKPVDPPEKPDEPSTVVAREWMSGNIGEPAAIWDTTLAAPAITDDNAGDDAGTFEIKLEVFNKDGEKVSPGGDTFEFLLREGENNTRPTDNGEVIDNAYVFRVHIDNNRVYAELPQPSIDGVLASDNCGFLRYKEGDDTRIEFQASHPNDHAVFRFNVIRGSNRLAAATAPSAGSTPNYVEVGSPTAATAVTVYNKIGAKYKHDFPVNQLVGSCVNAAFSATLSVYGKAYDGKRRLGIDASKRIAFALAVDES